jgi:hypothetical protein
MDMRIFHNKTHCSPKLCVALVFIIALFVLAIVSPSFQTAQLSIELEMKQYDDIQVFWSEGDSEVSKAYSQANSQVQRLSAGRRTAIFRIPGINTIDFLRIDPSNRETSFTLHSIRLSQPGFIPLIIDSPQKFKDRLTLQNVIVQQTPGGGIALQSLGNDPQLELHLDQSFSWLRYIADKKAEYLSFVSSQMELLGLDWGGFFFLGIDILLLLSLSATLLVRLGLNRKYVAELCLLLGLTGMAMVIASVIICGALSLLSWQNLLMSHGAIWLVVHLSIAKGEKQNALHYSRSNIRQTYGVIVRTLRDTLWPKEWTWATFVNALLLWAVLSLLLYYIIPAAFTLPLNFDSNDYRLSRVGYWLQEENIWQFASNDIRQAIMPFNCDIAMLWITSFFKQGYPLVHLISCFGGLLVCLSIYAFTQQLNFPKHFSLIAVLIWQGIPNSAAQMLTSQTDLFTTGCLMAGLYCFYQVVKHQRYWHYIYAGIGIGLSVGAKSTVFLWGPGLLFLCLAVVAGNLKTLKWKRVLKGTLLLSLFTVLFGGFVYAQNLVHYKNFLGPSNVVASISDSRDPVVKKDGIKQKMSKSSFVYLRAQAYVWQIFEPSSNLSVIRPLTDKGFDHIEEEIYKTNRNLKSSFVAMFKTAASWLRAEQLSEDYVSFGVVVFFLLLLGGATALSRSLLIRDSKSLAVSVLFVAVLLYMLFFAWIVGWTVHRYRYAVLVTPFLAIIAMYFLSLLAGMRKPLGQLFSLITVIIVGYQIVMAINVANNSRAHGWLAFRSPDKVYSYVFFWRDVRHLTDSLPDDVRTLGLVLAKGAWKSMFYRTGRDITSYTVIANGDIKATYAFLKDRNYDALITQKLSSISIEDHFNLLPSLINTYQALVPAMTPEDRVPWIMPNGYWSDGWVKLRGEVRIGNWPARILSLQLCNPAPVDEHIILKSSSKRYEIVLQANSECENIEISVNDNDFVSWRIDPGYHPWKTAGATETRSLGIQMKFPKPE